MGKPLDKDEFAKPNKEFGKANDSSAARGKQQPARSRRVYREQIQTRAERRKRLLEQDALGRTPLFYAAEKGLEEKVREIIFSFRGTGLSPTRLTLIATEDHSGLTAADLAEQNGHQEIARLLRSEQIRMEYYE